MFTANTDAVASENLRPLGVEPDSTATNVHGRPVPYVFGKTRLAVTFLSDPWDIYSTPITTAVGKDDQVTGYNYFCSFAAAVCLGPLDVLHAIYMDDSLVWEGPVSRAEADWIDLTIENRATLRFYWGTETQDPDADLNASGVEHPAYRGQCYAVFFDCGLGANKAAVPNIEFVVSRYPNPGWLTTSANVQDDCQPLAVLADLWTSRRYGLGLPAAYLDISGLNATAAILADEAMGVSGGH